MGVGFYFSISAFIIIFILTYIFYSKKRISNVETKIYGKLLILTLIGLSLEIVTCIWYVMGVSLENIIYQFASKLTSSYYMLWSSLFVNYIINICNENNTFKKNYNIVNLICFIIILILPIDYKTNGVGVTPSGPSIVLTYIICLTNTVIDLVVCLKNRNKISNSKFTPVYSLLALGGVDIFLGIFSPSLFLIGYVYSLIIIIMYFTIENPDVKLLEEVHKSKVISDTANEEKTMFLYNMTQEIRMVVNKINEDIDNILENKELDEIYNRARDIKSRATTFVSATNDILDMSSVDSETIKTYNSKYDIKNTLKQIVNIYNEECKKKMLEFRTNIDHDIPDSLYGDSISLKESLNKILRNSLNNTNTGYIELNVNTIIKNDICRLIITIEDSSNGIRSEELNTIKKDNKLLSEANSLIGVIQGTLLISSDYGVGTKIKVILDQKIVDSEETKEVTKYVNTLDNINVLVCDTDSGLKVITKLLDGSNVKLDKVDNGKELLESIKENKYDLVLMDESTSTNNQILVSKMRNVRNFNSEIILLTRDNSYEYNDEYKNLGFDDYILKPLKKDILLEKINKYKD